MENTDNTTKPTAFSIPTGKWGDKKFKLKNRFGHLTDTDLYFKEGGEQELLSRLAAKLGRTEADVQRLIDAL